VFFAISAPLAPFAPIEMPNVASCVAAVMAMRERNEATITAHASETAVRCKLINTHAQATDAWTRACRRLADSHSRACAIATRAHARACKEASAAWMVRRKVLDAEHSASVEEARRQYDAESDGVRLSNNAKREVHRQALAVRPTLRLLTLTLD
jgi:hypothetical protein